MSSALANKFRSLGQIAYCRSTRQPRPSAQRIALDLARSCLPPLLAARQPCLPRRHAARSTARYHGQHASGFPGFFEVTVWAEERSGLHDVLGVELAGPPAELGIPNSPCLQGVNGLALT